MLPAAFPLPFPALPSPCVCGGEVGIDFPLPPLPLSLHLSISTGTLTSLTTDPDLESLWGMEVRTRGGNKKYWQAEGRGGTSLHR